MSLINSILGQKIILVLVGGALLIFLVAVGINFVSAMRASAKRRAKRMAVEQARIVNARKARARAKAAKIAEREAARAAAAQAIPTLADELGEAAVLVVSDAKVTAAEAAAAELTAPMASMAGPTANAPVAAAILPSMPVQALGGAPSDQPKKEEKSDKASEIQSLLDDVFVDEEAQERMAMLLGDAESVKADDLLAQLSKLAKDLGAGKEPPADEQKTSRAS